jgi:hypothetical protein
LSPFFVPFALFCGYSDLPFLCAFASLREIFLLFGSDYATGRGVKELAGRQSQFANKYPQ